jgi:hypothetical protein
MPDAVQQVDPDSPNSINMSHLFGGRDCRDQTVPALTPAA